MPIVFELRKNGVCPRIICDICKEPIEDGEGNVYYDKILRSDKYELSKKGDTANLIFTHKKVSCVQKVDREYVSCEELDVFFYLLIHNTKVNLKEGQRRFAILSRI